MAEPTALDMELHLNTTQEVLHSSLGEALAAIRNKTTDLSAVIEKNVRAAFDFIDVNHDLSLSRREIVDSINKSEELRQLLLIPKGKYLKASDFESIFTSMDEDGDNDITFEEFHQTMSEMLSKDWRDQITEMDRKEAEEIERLKEEGKWQLEKAKRRVITAHADFSPLVSELEAFFGVKEAAKEVEKIKKNTKMMMLSDRPVEKKAAEAWYEVREAERLLRLLEMGNEVGIPDPKYDVKLKEYETKLQEWVKWNDVEFAYHAIIGDTHDKLSVAEFCEEAKKRPDVMECFARNKNVSDSSLTTKLLFSCADEIDTNVEKRLFDSPTTAVLFSAAASEGDGEGNVEGDVEGDGEEKKESGSPTAALLFGAAASEGYGDGEDKGDGEEKKESGSPTAALLFGAAASEGYGDGEDKGDGEEKKESGSPTAALLFGASEASSQDNDTTSSRVKSIIDELCSSLISLSVTTATPSTPMTLSHLQHFLSPSIGRPNLAYTLLNTSELGQIKASLFSDSSTQALLNLTPGSSKFESIYLQILNHDPLKPFTAIAFASLFVPHYDEYMIWKDINALFPPSAEDSISKSNLLRYWESKTQQIVVSTCKKYIADLIDPDNALTSILELLPDDGITKAHLTILLAPRYTKKILPPDKFLSNDGDESDSEDDLVNSPGTSLSPQGEQNVPSLQASGPVQTLASQKVAVQAAFRLMNEQNKSTIPKQEVIKHLRDNKLIQGLLNLPATNHAHSARWKIIMKKMNAIPEDMSLEMLTDIFVDNLLLTHQEEHDDPFSASYNKAIIPTIVKEEVIVERQVPTLNLQLAEDYVNVKKAFDMLDVNNDNELTLGEIKKQLLSNEELRKLLNLTDGNEKVSETIKRIEFRAMNGSITWDIFRSMFITLSDDAEKNASDSPILNEQTKSFAAHEVDVWRSGNLSGAEMLRNIANSAEAEFNRTKDDQEPMPAFSYDDGIVADLNWRREAEEEAKEDGPPPIPNRGSEIILNTPFIDGPQWFVVMSPREDLGVEGPMGIKQLIEFWDEEIIDSHTLVWKEGLVDWLPVEMVTDLKAQLLLPELHESVRPVTAPGVLSGIPKKKKQISNPKPTKLDYISLDRPCRWCGITATMHIDGIESIRPLKQGIASSGVSSDDPDKSEILHSFLYVGNASSGREKNVEIMEYTHIINVSKDLPCFFDLHDDCNAWLREYNIVINDDNKFDDEESLAVESGNDDGSLTKKQKAFIKFRSLQRLNIKYFRVALDDNPFGRPDTAASKYTLQSWRESEFSSRPLSALTDPLFAGMNSRPATNTSNRLETGSRPAIGSRPATSSRPATGMSGMVSRPMTGGGSRPLTAAEVDAIPEFEITTEESDYALGYAAAAINIQSIARGHSIRSREGGLRGIISGGLTSTENEGDIEEQEELLQKAADELAELRKQPITDIIQAFEAVYEWLHRENMSRKVRCLIHSRTGTVSAVAVTAAYIIRSQGLKYEEVRSHLQAIHGIEKVMLGGTVWEDALRQYSAKYAIGELICDDCFLDNFVEGKADDRIMSEEVEMVVKRLKENDKSLILLDLRDECLGSGVEKEEGVEEGGEDEVKGKGMSLLCEALRESYWLIELNFSGNMITDSDCELISSALLTNRGLESLHLSYNHVGDVGAKEITSALQIHELFFLDLSFNKINEKGGEFFGNMLRKNKTLTDLNLGNNELGDEGGHVLFDALTTPLYESEEIIDAKTKIYEAGGNLDDLGDQFNGSLTNLDVSCNNLGQKSAKRLIGVLQNNCVLCKLNLDYNPNLGHTEAREIANAMRVYGSNLAHLSFSDNNVGNDVAGAFAKTINAENNSKITRLSFSQNALRSIGVSRLASSISTNDNLQFLDISR